LYGKARRPPPTLVRDARREDAAGQTAGIRFAARREFIRRYLAGLVPSQIGREYHEKQRCPLFLRSAFGQRELITTCHVATS
jgi:hypothetical protein